MAYVSRRVRHEATDDHALCEQKANRSTPEAGYQPFVLVGESLAVSRSNSMHN
jgi:hypothetical protein